MSHKALTEDELLALLEQGNWIKSFPADCPKRPSQARVILNVIKKTLNGVAVIQYGKWGVDGPVGHIPLTPVMEFRQVSTECIEVWKKGTLRYCLEKKSARHQ